jgi:hypothetical protein
MNFDVVNSEFIFFNLSKKQLHAQYLCFIICLLRLLGTAVAQWLRYCTTNRKVAGSIPDYAIGIFH